MALSFIDSRGSPLVVLPQAHLGDWRGSVNDFGGTDFDEVCAIHDYVGIIKRSWGQILVLSDESAVSATLPFGSHLAVARWDSAPCAKDAAALATLTPDSLAPALESHEFEVTESPLVLIEAAAPGEEARISAPVELPPGKYRVAVHSICPVSETKFQIIVFRPQR